ncbi:hypothetical protein [Ferruginibacter sp.]
MLFLYFVIWLSLILYARFFIKNSLQTKIQRTQTFNAAIKALYFIPVFQQALFLLCISLIHFCFIGKSFFIILCSLFFADTNAELYSLMMINFIGVSSVLLCVTFILAKISMNRKMDAINMLYKMAYLLCWILMPVIIFYNLHLLNPFTSSFTQLVFYNNPYVILLNAVFYCIVLLRPYFYKTTCKTFRYFHLSVKISLACIGLSFLLAVTVFILYLLLRLTP